METPNETHEQDPATEQGEAPSVEDLSKALMDERTRAAYYMQENATLRDRILTLQIQSGQVRIGE